MADCGNNKVKKVCIITTVPGTIKSFALETADHLYKTCGYDMTFICDYDADFEKSLPEHLRYIPVSMSRGIDFSGFISVWKFYKVFRKI